MLTLVAGQQGPKTVDESRSFLWESVAFDSDEHKRIRAAQVGTQTRLQAAVDDRDFLLAKQIQAEQTKLADETAKLTDETAETAKRSMLKEYVESSGSYGVETFLHESGVRLQKREKDAVREGESWAVRGYEEVEF